MKLDMNQVSFAVKWVQVIPSMTPRTWNFGPFLTTQSSEREWDSYINKAGVLVVNFEKNVWEVLTSCFIGMAWDLF